MSDIERERRKAEQIIRKFMAGLAVSPLGTNPERDKLIKEAWRGEKQKEAGQ